MRYRNCRPGLAAGSPALVHVSSTPSSFGCAPRSAGAGSLMIADTCTRLEGPAPRALRFNTSTAYVSSASGLSLIAFGGSVSMKVCDVVRLGCDLCPDFLVVIVGGGTVATGFSHAAMSASTPRQIRVGPSERKLSWSVVSAGSLQVRVTKFPLRATRRSEAGLGNSSDGGSGTPVWAQPASSRQPGSKPMIFVQGAFMRK